MVVSKSLTLPPIVCRRSLKGSEIKILSENDCINLRKPLRSRLLRALLASRSKGLSLAWYRDRKALILAEYWYNHNVDRQASHLH